jgi:hypothetical protein
LRRHKVENLSKVLVAQSSIWSRLNFWPYRLDWMHKHGQM